MREPTNHTAPCPRCDGAGRVPLFGTIIIVLAKLQKAASGTTARAIYHTMPKRWRDSHRTVTSINNHLVRLARMGLAERVDKVSNSVIWKAVDVEAAE